MLVKNKSRGGHIVAIKDTIDIMPLIEEIFKHYGHVKDGDFMRELMERREGRLTLTLTRLKFLIKMFISIVFKFEIKPLFFK